MIRCWPASCLLLLLLGASATADGRLSEVPDKPGLSAAPAKYLAVFEVRDDAFVGKHLRDREAAELGLACWERIKVLFPLSYRKLIVQFNIMGGRRLAGAFGGSGKNDVGRAGFQLSVARFCAAEERGLRKPGRAVTRRRGTLDWTLVHELGHYICLRMNVIELFSQSYDGDDVPQPKRREKPDDYPKDGTPRLDGDFVTSYAERTGGDEEVVETFTTYMLARELPKGDALVARKLRFFDTIPGFPELRRRIQAIGGKK